MKRLFFLSLFACLAAPAFAQPKPLPPEVRAMVPQNIVSLGTYELSPAPGASKYLVHLWTAPRRDPLGEAGMDVTSNPYKGPITRHEVKSNLSLFDSPFVLDIFSDEPEPQYRTSIIYTATRAPDALSLRYFNSQTKKGLIFEVDDSTPRVTIHTFWVFENGLGGPYKMDTRTSWKGGDYHERYGLSRDAKGDLQLVHVVAGPYFPEKRELFVWDGKRFTSQK